MNRFKDVDKRVTHLETAWLEAVKRDFARLIEVWRHRARCAGMSPAEEVAWLAIRDGYAAYDVLIKQFAEGLVRTPGYFNYHVWRYGPEILPRR
jgi:hypothetical protein